MCFSATASFSVGAVLAPVAAFTLSRARCEPRWLALAAYPLAFGIQQLTEGLLWLAIDAKDALGAAITSRGFLFFSHFFWPAWVPLSVYWLELSAERWRRHILLALSVLGIVFGISISVPSLIWHDWLAVEIVGGSIEYVTRLVYDGIVGRQALKYLYGVIVVAALFLSREKMVQMFGGIILASLIFAEANFGYAFVSIWCFFAAVLSVYIAVILSMRVKTSDAAQHAS